MSFAGKVLGLPKPMKRSVAGSTELPTAYLQLFTYQSAQQHGQQHAASRQWSDALSVEGAATDVTQTRRS